MSIHNRFLLKSSLSTVVAYGFCQVLRVGTNIVLARLLAPELFGVMLIANSLKSGIEVTTDVGIGQNIVFHKEANNPDYYNTAWTLQVIRGIAVWLVALALAGPIAQFYDYPILVFIVPLTAFTSVILGLSSVSRPLAQKRLQIGRLNLFDVITMFTSSAIMVVAAYLNRTIWAFVFAGLFGSAVVAIATFFLLPDVKQRFHLSKPFVWQILHFGKWITLSSIVSFMAMNFDRLYLAKIVPLAILGVYGIARSISELFGMAIGYLGNTVLFPFIASQSTMIRADLRKQLAPLRAKLLLLLAVAISLAVATADLAIRVFYDERYQAASWMLPVLIVGSWFSILTGLNESTLLGFGKPSYGAFANSLKLLILIIGLGLGVKTYGLVLGVVVVALADTCRYIPFLIGQRREHFSFVMQDMLFTIGMFSLVGLWEWLRWVAGFGTSFASLPI
jgi:O-antigen/teichoic acid export membrane protein